MGKGIIKSGGDDGLYGIELTLHRDRVDATIEIINAQIEALAAKINGMEEGDAKDLEKLRRASYQKRKDYLQLHMPEDPTISAWCGDLTEDLSGNVGTIEIPGERGIVQIQPGHESNAAYNTERDGQLQPAIANTPAGTFYNLAMLPGWQKWMPTYRHGTISNIDTDNDTCNVALEAATSSQQDLNVNQVDTLTGVLIEYMSCNASAFEDGDEVLVKFEGQDWSGAKVVGFKDNPKACGFQFKLTRGDGTLVDSAEYEWATIFSCRNASEQNFAPENVEYNEETQYWSFNIPEFAKDEDGYWIKFNWIEDSIPTVYPYKYKTADQYQEADLIKPGKYEAAVPYWDVTYTGVPGYIGCDEDVLDFNFVNGVAKGGSYIYLDGGTCTKKTNVKSSVPYEITWKTRDNIIRTKRANERWNVSSMTYQFGECPVGTPVAHKCCIFYDNPYSSCSIGNTAGGPFTVVANTINLTITDDPILVETDIVEFSGSIGGTDHIATYSGGGVHEEIPICDVGPQATPPCDPCENVGNTPHDYTHWFPGVYDCITITPNYDY